MGDLLRLRVEGMFLDRDNNLIAANREARARQAAENVVAVHPAQEMLPEGAYETPFADAAVVIEHTQAHTAFGRSSVELG